MGRNRWAECIVAVDGDVPVGFAIISRHFEAHTGKRQLRISDLFVEEPARGIRIGVELFKYVLQHARALGCDEVMWEVWRKNLPAYRFYERLGAEHVDDVSIMRIEL